jgi:dolichol-phosphate mannosyltransferase
MTGRTTGETAAARAGEPPPVPEAMARRFRTGLGDPANWLQLLRFALVGGTGYLVNLAVFAVAVGPAGAGHRLAATAAFLVAVTNNFVLNRSWTFPMSPRRVHHQAVRFLVVSVAGFLVNLGVLEALVVGAGLPDLPAQALAVAVAMPVNFLGNRQWTFR